MVFISRTVFLKILVSLAAACAALFAPPMQAQDLGCSSEVALNGAVIEVTSTSGGDDTENIQCALSAATDNGYRDVFLISPEYAISGLQITGFSGDLRGKSKAGTTVNVTDASLACEGGVPATVIRFNLGSPSVRNMTLALGEPCGNGGVVNAISFFTDPADCAGDVSRTAFGNVDRVVISGIGLDGGDVVSGVVMDAAPECDAATQKILGTLKVNRSAMTGLEFGVLTSIGGGGQVDINYNELSEVGLPISMVDANQSTTILGNTISYHDTAYDAGTGLGTTAIFLASTEDSPSKNGTTIKSNTFNDGGSTSEGYAVLSGQTGKSITHSIVVTGNTFNGASANTGGSGLAMIDTSDGLVSGNSFKGFSGSWIALTSGSVDDGFLGTAVSGWAVVANAFSASTATTDITLGADTENNIVGRSQNEPVVDDLGSNDVLESAMATSFFRDTGPITVGPETLYQRQFETLKGGRVPARGLQR